MQTLLGSSPAARLLSMLPPPGTRFLITGGAGFIGSHLADDLLARGMKVRVLDDFSSGRRSNLRAADSALEVQEGSVANPAVCRSACEGVTYVLHHAAIPSVPRSIAHPREAHETNVTGTLNLLEAARTVGVRRLVFAASSSAYGDQPAPTKSESLLPDPLSPYAAGKLAAEHYLAVWNNGFGLETVSLRYFNVFGPRQDPKSDYAAVVPRFVTAMLRGQQPVIYGDGGQTRDFTPVANNVLAVLLACVAPKAPGRVINVACGSSHSLLNLVERINAILGTSIAPRFEPARTGDIRHSAADIALAREVLGFEPIVSFEEGLRKTVDWFKTTTV